MARLDNEKGNRLVRNIEALIDQGEVCDLFFFAGLRRLMPAALFKKLLYRMSARFPLMGFVIEPWCLFFFFKIKDVAAAQAQLPDRYELIQTRVFEGEEPAYYYGMSFFNTRASTFRGSRLEAYLVARDRETGITSWVFADILSDTLIAHPKWGITAPNCIRPVCTTNPHGEIIVDFTHTGDKRRIAFSGSLTGGKERPLDQDLWVMGNSSIAHSKTFQSSDDETFAVVFDPAEVEQALDIPPEAFTISHNSMLPAWVEPAVVKTTCFPWDQHYVADSPGRSTRVLDQADMMVKAARIAQMHDMKTFSARSIKVQFFTGIVLNAIALISLVLILLLR